MIALDKFGFRLGTKRARAATLYEKGATQAEMIAATGTTQYNMLKDATRRGHRVTTRDGRTWLYHKDDKLPRSVATAAIPFDPPIGTKMTDLQRLPEPTRQAVKRTATSAALLSIVGWHGNESPEQILTRKIKDIQIGGHTLWVYQSWKARRDQVAVLARNNPGMEVYFLEGGAAPTSRSEAASQFSPDGINWEGVSPHLGPVTGKLSGGVALMLDELSIVSDRWIDLWEYVDHELQQPLKFARGASTVCAAPVPSGHAPGMKSRHRRIVAVGRLCAPYAVSIR